MESLEKIQKLSKVGKIICKIIFICGIIGAIGCVVGIACLPFENLGNIKLGNITIHNLIVNEAGVELKSLYPVLSGTLIICIGQAVLAKIAERYFINELDAGTPFTEAGAKELQRLGILIICINLGAQTLSQIIVEIIEKVTDCSVAFKINDVGSIAMGILFIFMSLLCRYGAELESKNKK